MKIIRTASPAIREQDKLTVGCAQIAPVWLQRTATLQKVLEAVEVAAAQGCQLVCFGEALVPGYPFWVERTDGARFNDAKQKAIFAHYLDQSVDIARGDLEPLCQLAAKKKIAIYVGIIEAAADRGGHSLYCSLVYIDASGTLCSVHRKLQPTYEERLVWAHGDGNGLLVHPLAPFRVGGLNCYENWMPLVRASLYAQGEDLHVSVWPGGAHNTHDIATFIAKESRSYVVAVSALMRISDFPVDTLSAAEIIANSQPFLANGGTTIAGPDGALLIEPVVECEALVIAELDHAKVRAERQNFDVSGHYSRPDVTRLSVNRNRQRLVDFVDQSPGAGAVQK